MATFRKRAGGWRVEVRMQGHYRSATFEAKTTARIWAADIESKIRAGILEESSGKTVGEAMARYARDVSPGKGGARWESVRLVSMQADELAAVLLSDVRRGDIAAYRDRRLKHVKGSSVNRELNLLSAVFATAVAEWHWLSENPCRGVKRPKNPAPRDRRVSDKELQRLCLALGYDDALPVETKQQEVALAFLLAIETAMRAGEILGLTWSQVNLPKRYCTLLDSKNGDSRDVPLTKEAVRLLEKCPGKTGLFTVQGESMSVLFRKARIRAGIEDLTFHDSRHEAITRLARKLDILDLARMVGHRDLSSLQIYYNATASEIASRLD